MTQVRCKHRKESFLKVIIGLKHEREIFSTQVEMELSSKAGNKH